MLKKRFSIAFMPAILLILVVGVFGLKTIIEKGTDEKTLIKRANHLNPEVLNSAINSNKDKATSSATKVTPTITPKPTAQLSFEEMNKLYGPCAKVNVLMYHHIQEESIAKARGQSGLTVTPEFFRKHLQYLKDNGYSVILPQDLASFFNGGSLPKKAAMITLDDGYEDNYSQMYPILKEFGYKATVFVATGLTGNPDYMTWDNISSMKDLVYFGNHTWSHHPSSGTFEVQQKEIGTADSQLSEHGVNAAKIFAYPYGSPSGTAEKALREKGYGIAFTTVHGNVMCKGQSLELPRIRVGNAPLSRYGL